MCPNALGITDYWSGIIFIFYFLPERLLAFTMSSTSEIIFTTFFMTGFSPNFSQRSGKLIPSLLSQGVERYL